MNNVSIKYSYLSQHCNMEINGAEIGVYSNLSSICSRPFSESVPFINKGLDEELGDDYSIDYYSLSFQCNILKSFAENSEYCKGINYHNMDTVFSARDVYIRLSQLCDKYEIMQGISIATKVFIEDDTIRTPSLPEIEIVDLCDAEVAIFRNVENIPENVNVAVCLSETYKYRRINGKNCFMVPLEGLEDFWDYYFMFEKMIPYIAESMKAFKYRKLDESDRIELEVLQSGNPAYYLGSINATMDKGEAVVIPFASFPAGLYKLESTNRSVLDLRDETVIAKSAGTASITVVDASGKAADSRTVTVIAHQYVQNIRLIQSFEYMKRNQKTRIEAIAEPANAEDAEYLEWTSTDPSVAQIDDRGNIIALSEGKTIITCRGKEVNSFVEIEVKPELTGLRINPSSISINTGEQQVLEVVPIPSNAPVDHLQWELDNRNIANLTVSSATKLRCQVSASSQYTGKGNVSVYDTETRIRSVAQLEVKMKQKISGGCGTCLITCLIILGIFVVIAFLGSLL